MTVPDQKLDNIIMTITAKIAYLWSRSYLYSLDEGVTTSLPSGVIYTIEFLTSFFVEEFCLNILPIFVWIATWVYDFRISHDAIRSALVSQCDIILPVTLIKSLSFAVCAAETVSISKTGSAGLPRLCVGIELCMHPRVLMYPARKSIRCASIFQRT